jgi:peptidoglycan hydrolase CwlO-like protein
MNQELRAHLNNLLEEKRRGIRTQNKTITELEDKIKRTEEEIKFRKKLILEAEEVITATEDLLKEESRP